MQFITTHKYVLLTRADIRNPKSPNLSHYSDLLSVFPSIFLYSNGFRKQNSLIITFFEEQTNEYFSLEFVGEKLRYLSPDWLSSGALIVKAFKKRINTSHSKKEKIFVNPGVFLYYQDLISKKLPLIEFYFVKGTNFEIKKLIRLLNTNTISDNSIVGLIPEDFSNYSLNRKESIIVESFSQAITIMNFSLDNKEKLREIS